MELNADTYWIEHSQTPIFYFAPGTMNFPIFGCDRERSLGRISRFHLEILEQQWQFPGYDVVGVVVVGGGGGYVSVVFRSFSLYTDHCEQSILVGNSALWYVHV